MDGKLRNMASVYLMSGDKILFLYRIGLRVVNDSYVGSAGGHFEKEELNDARVCLKSVKLTEFPICLLSR